jgi:hypothetical protein
MSTLRTPAQNRLAPALALVAAAALAAPAAVTAYPNGPVKVANFARWGAGVGWPGGAVVGADSLLEGRGGEVAREGV